VEGDGGLMAMSREHVLGVAVLAGAGLLVWAGMRQAGGANPPSRATTEGLYTTPDPVTPYQPEPGSGYLFARHRYPERVGHEITCLIQGGHSVASVPRFAEAYLIDRPPSELDL